MAVFLVLDSWVVCVWWVVQGFRPMVVVSSRAITVGFPGTALNSLFPFPFFYFGPCWTWLYFRYLGNGKGISPVQKKRRQILIFCDVDTWYKHSLSHMPYWIIQEGTVMVHKLIAPSSHLDYSKFLWLQLLNGWPLMPPSSMGWCTLYMHTLVPGVLDFFVPRQANCSWFRKR